jgi:hypothetical protein
MGFIPFWEFWLQLRSFGCALFILHFDVYIRDFGPKFGYEHLEMKLFNLT